MSGPLEGKAEAGLRVPNIFNGLRNTPPCRRSTSYLTPCPLSLAGEGVLFGGLPGAPGGAIFDIPMPIVAVSRRVHFNAAHRLHNPRQSDEWNARTFGPCNNPNWHGHNYELDLTVEGPVAPDTGYVMDVGILKELAEQHVVSRLDHKNLNLDVEWFR